jgi:hypothetical protein
LRAADRGDVQPVLRGDLQGEVAGLILDVETNAVELRTPWPRVERERRSVRLARMAAPSLLAPFSCR